MSGIPHTKMLSKLGRRRRMFAFLSVATATFLCLSMIWPLSIKSWRSESEIAVTLSERKNSSNEFQKVLGEVVKRHTSPESITRVVERHGLKVDRGNVPSWEMANLIHQRLNVVLLNDSFDPAQFTVRVGLDGVGFDDKSTEQENFLVNMLATTIARDFMTSPLAGILPSEPVPTDDVETLQMRHAQIEKQANQLLSQIQSNLQQSADELVLNEDNLVVGGSDTVSDAERLTLRLDEMYHQRERISASENSMLELAAIDQQINEVRSEIARAQKSDSQPRLFHMASHSNGSGSLSSAESVSGLINSLHTTIGDLANVAAEACSAAETASRVRPAFTVMGVQGNAPTPVGAIPSRKELLFLLLASSVFATIVSVAYKPFAERGFENVEQIAKKLNLPVIATLNSRNTYEDITGTGIPVESRNVEMPGSNQVVGFCKWILFCGLMLTIGFCLVNSDIRDAFLVSPFHGFAQIVWTLKGY